MKRINREAIQRMVDARGGKAVGTSGGGGGSLAGYATQAWVNEGFVSIEFFNRLFTVYGPGETSSDPDVVIEPNDLDSTITNIKAMFGLWTEQYLSALGLNPGGTGSATSLSMLDDVDITTPTNGQALVYNSTTLKWENATISTVTALANLTDVLLTSPTANEFLMYDGTSAKWINSAIKTINGQSLYGSGDISVGGGASGNYLQLSGGTLVGELIINTGTYAHQLTIKRNSTADPSIVFTNNNNINRLFGSEASKSLADSFYFSDITGDTKYYILNTGNTTTRNIVLDGTPYEVLSKYNTDITINTNSVLQTLANSNNDTYRPIIVGDSWSLNPSSFATITSSVMAVGNVYVQPSSGKIFSCDIEPKTDLTYKIGSSTSMYAKGYFRIIDTINSYDLRLYASGVEGIRLRAGTTVNVGIGYDEPDYRLSVNGSIYASGAITALSDINQKNVEQYNAHLGIDEVANAPVIKFTWKDPKAEDNGLQVGSIAQYWEKVMPEAVKRDKEGTLSMSYGVVALVAAISTAKKVQEHERRIADLECENKKLKGQLRRLNRYGKQ